jgi:preprotein translocase subunit YajC
MNNEQTFKPGQQVTANGGYPGRVVRMYSKGMVEVRLASGLVCVPVEDVVAV